MSTTSRYAPTASAPSRNGAHPPTRASLDLPALPDSVLRPGRARLRTWMHRAVGLVVVAALGTAAFVFVERGRGDGATTLRTGVTAPAEIVSTYSVVATIEPVDQATVGFPTAGTVASVEVAAGDAVEVGDALATLDTADLEQALRAAQADLADAQNVLATALAGDDPTSLLAGGGAFPGVALSDTEVVFAYASALVDDAEYVLAAVSDSDISAAQQAVVAAQAAVNEATNSAAAALDSAVSVCAAVQTDITPYIDPDDPTATIHYPTDTIVACRSALDSVIAAQQTLTTRQSELSAAANALSSLLDQRAADLDAAPTTTTMPVPEGPTTTSTVPATTPDMPTEPSPATLPPEDGGTSGGTGGLGGLPSGGGGLPSGGGGVAVAEYEPTAEELISYQNSVDAAGYAVAAAEQAIDQATIVSPIAGTVASVGFAVGDDLSAGDAAIVVLGEGGMEATTTVSIDDIDQLEVGQAVAVSPDGSSETMTGEVVAIGITPDSASSTSSYRVTIGLNGDTSALRSGNLGNADITVAATSAATAVPTSAVKLDARGYYVTVVAADRTTSRQNVQIGVVGSQWTEVTSGIEAGQTVALTDPSAASLADAEPDSAATSGAVSGDVFTPPTGGFPDFGNGVQP